MIRVPLRKLGELVTKPVMDPSSFWTHFDKAGMVSLGVAGVEAFLAGDASVKALKMDIVLRLFVCAGAGFGSALGFGAKIARVGRLGASTLALACGLAAAGFAVAGLDVSPKNEKTEGAGFFGSGVGAGVGAAALAAGLLLKKEKEDAGAFFGAGTGVGAGAGAAALAAGLLLKKEKEGAGAFFGAGAGVGAGAGAAALAAALGTAAGFLLPPKKEAKASVTGSLVSSLGAGLSFSSGTGAGADAFFGAAGLLSKREARLNVGRDAAVFALGATLGAGAGAGAGAFFAAGTVGLVSKMEAKFNVGLGALGGAVFVTGLGGAGATFLTGATCFSGEAKNEAKSPAGFAGAAFLAVGAALATGATFLAGAGACF